MPGRLVLLITTPRVASGLLSAPAWDALRSADRVLTVAEDHPQVAALRAAGIDVGFCSDRDGGAGPGSASIDGLAHRLLDAAADGSVVWLSDPEGEPALDSALAAGLVGGADVEIEVLPASYDLPGAHLLDLVEVMDRLRSPGGCPWDAEQTHESLVPYLIEETYEVVEAIESDDAPHLREELGDLLLQVAFHARVAQDSGSDAFTIDDVADGIVTKLVHRHPHVFGGDEIPAGREGAVRVESRWEEIKAAEKARSSVLDGIPPGLPALAYASKLITRARRAGLAPPDHGALPDVHEPANEQSLDEDRLGAELLRLVVEATSAGLDAEGALRRAVGRFAIDIRAAEERRAG